MDTSPSEVLPLLTTLKKILVDNYVLTKNEKTPIELKRLLKFSLPLIFGGIPFAIGSIGYVHISIQRNLWPQPLQSLLLLIQMLTTSLVLLIFLSNSKNYFISINRMSKYNFGAPRKCRKIIKKTNNLCLIVYYMAKVVITLQALLFYWFETSCDNPEFEADDGYVCGSFCPLWFFFKVDSPFVLVFIRTSIAYISISYLPILIVLVASPLTTNYLILMRIRELKKLISQISETEREQPPTRDQIVFFIEYHREITECIHVSNKSLSYDHLPIQIFLPIILALYTYQIVRTHDFVAIGYLMLWFFPYFSLCLLGERLQYESSTIPVIVYESKWYNIDDSRIKTIFKMFLFVLSRPIKLKLRPLAALNHLLLIKILKTAYSFLVFFVDTTK